MKPTWVGVAVLALVLAVVSCGDDLTPAADPDTPYDEGFSRADVLDGIRSVEQLTAQCMADRGFEYSPRAPEDRVVFTEDRPGYGVAQGLLDAIRGEEVPAPDPSLNGVPPAERRAYIDARTLCNDEAVAHLAGLQDSVRSSYDRLDGAWEDFRASSDYRGAVQRWSTCMADHGYDFRDLSEPESFLIDLLSEVTDVEMMEDIPMDEVLVIQAQEIALYEADQTCRAVELAAMEREFKADLFTRYAEDVAAIRRATRGES